MGSVFKRAIASSTALALTLGMMVLAHGCGEERPEQPARAAKGAEARVRLAVQELLATHHLLGKQPGERTEEEKRDRLDDDAVSRFFADSKDFEPFTSDIYRGFVLGALARHQTRLFIDARGSKATVHAGDAAIKMGLEDGSWKVFLKESIPAGIAERAAREKARFEKAMKERRPPNP